MDPWGVFFNLSENLNPKHLNLKPLNLTLNLKPTLLLSKPQRVFATPLD